MFNKLVIPTGGAGGKQIEPTLLSNDATGMTVTVSCDVGDTLIVSAINANSEVVQIPTITGGTIELFEYGTKASFSSNYVRATMLVVKATASSVTITCTSNYNNLRPVVIKV